MLKQLVYSYITMFKTDKEDKIFLFWDFLSEYYEDMVKSHKSVKR